MKRGATHAIHNQNANHHTGNQLCPFCVDRSKDKVMLEVVFDSKGIVYQ
jgi:recombinational DNA repair protein RecR